MDKLKFISGAQYEVIERADGWYIYGSLMQAGPYTRGRSAVDLPDFERRTRRLFSGPLESYVAFQAVAI